MKFITKTNAKKGKIIILMMKNESDLINNCYSNHFYIYYKNNSQANRIGYTQGYTILL